MLRTQSPKWALLHTSPQFEYHDHLAYHVSPLVEEKTTVLAARHALILTVLAAPIARSLTAEEPIALRYSVGLSNGAKDSDGVTFRVEITDPERGKAALHEVHWAGHEWKEVEADLSPYAGRTVIIRFVTAPGQTTTYDWALWGEPQVVRGGKVVTDFTKVKPWRSGILMAGKEAGPMRSNSTGATFRFGKQLCGSVRKRGFFAHPPYKADAVGGATFAEYRLTVGEPVPSEPRREPMPVMPTETSPFPLGDAPCFRLSSNIAVDGSLDDWPAAVQRAALCVREKRQMSVERVSHKPGWKAGWLGPRDFSSAFYLGWDDEALYLAEVRRDDVLQFMDSMSWDFTGSDSLRVCISKSPTSETLTENDYVLAILPDGEEGQPMVRLCSYGHYRHEGFRTDAIEVAPRLFSGGWVMEVKLPFDAMGIEPSAGMTLGFQLILTDSDTPMDRHYEMLWKPKESGDYWRKPSTFGRLTLCHDSFAWIDLGRRVFAQDERPLLGFGLFSIDGATEAKVDIRLRTAQGEALPFCDTNTATNGATILCKALTSCCGQTIDYSLRAGRDSLAGTIPIEVVEDRPAMDLTRLTQPSTPTLLPSVACASYTNRVTEQGERFVFEYAGDDETVRYEYRPGFSFDLAMLVDGEVVYRSDPSKTGPQLAKAKKIDAEAIDVKLTGKRLTYSCRLAGGTEVSYGVEIQGKTLVIDVASDSAQFAALRGPLHGIKAKVMSVPYLDWRNPPLLLGDHFLTSYCDWTVTGASHLQRFGSSEYRAKTDGTRNPLRDRVYVTVSSEMLEVLPNLPNPRSPFFDELSRKVVADIWGWGSRFSDAASYLEELKGYGVDELAIIYHVWQRHGYDNGLPEHYPANAGRGGDADMRILGATAKRLGYLLSLHENYIDYYPNFPHYTEDAIARDSRGEKVLAWYMPSTGIQSFRMKPSWIERYVREQSPEIHKRYQTTAAYLDVHSVSLPFHLDFDTRAEGSASFGYSFEKLTWLFNYLRETHAGPLFGEGNFHAAWAGRIDGCEAQIGGRGGEIQPPLVDYDLLKVHPLAVNHGMGYYSRWHRTRRGRLKDEEMDKYRAYEIAYGHAGFFGSGMMQHLTQVLREYHLVQPLQSVYTRTVPKEIRYLFDVTPSGDGRWVSSRVACRTKAPRKIHVAYDNGLQIWVNDHRDNWRVGKHVLPSYGFVAEGAGIEAWTVKRNGGFIADYAETADRIFADPRTYESLYTSKVSVVDITPLEPSVVHKTGRQFEITYRWDVQEAPDKDYRVFVHFTDPEGQILWQNDHHTRVLTSRWQVGARYEDGPYQVEAPTSIAPGTYDIRVGMFIPKMGRLGLAGEDAGGCSYLVGRLKIGAGDEQMQVALVPRHPKFSGHRPGRNPFGTQVDFGKVQTNITLVIHKEDDGLVIMPIPHGEKGQVRVRLDRLLPAARPGAVRVSALDQNRQQLRSVAAAVAGYTATFETSIHNAWYYEVKAQ